MSQNPLCARVLLSPEDMNKFRKMIRSTDFSYIARKKTRRLILEKAKKVSVCPHCGEANGVVKKSHLKITYEKYRNLKKENPVRILKLGIYEKQMNMYLYYVKEFRTISEFNFILFLSRTQRSCRQK